MGSHATPAPVELLLKLRYSLGPGWPQPPSPRASPSASVPATCLGFALEVEGQHVFPRPSLTLADDEEAMAPGPTCQHQLSCLDP